MKLSTRLSDLRACLSALIVVFLAAIALPALAQSSGDGGGNGDGSAPRTAAASPPTGNTTPRPIKPVAQPLDLMDAYKKEYAFLEAERDALRKRLGVMKAQTRTEVGRLEGAIQRRQKDLLALRDEAEKISLDLDKITKEAADVDEQAGIVPETIERATQSMDKAGARLPKVSDNETVQQQLDRMHALVTEAGEHIVRNGKIRKEKGIFFAQDGARVEGEIVSLGGVAKFGVSDSLNGALVPAGNGHFKIWPDDAAATATGLANGEVPSTLRMYLYDNPDKVVEPKVEKTVEGIINSGGTIAWVIVGLGAIALLLILFRAGLLIVLGASKKSALEAVEKPLAVGDLAGARIAAARGRGAVGRVVRATVGALGQPREALEDTISESVLGEVPRIERFGTTITVIAAVAPLLGLLGTVTGMISTFDIITEFGTGDPKLLAGGISEALVTTELGLVVAIPTLLLGTLLSGRASQIQVSIERGALHVVNVAQLAGLTADPPGDETPATPSPADSDGLAWTHPSTSLETSSVAAAS